MKNWTCLFLSGVMMLISLIPKISFGEMFLTKTMELFFGISNETTAREIIIDLSQEDVSEKMKIEIERIKKEVDEEAKQPQESPAAVKKPSVLIYHTHTDEAFFKGDRDYKETSTGRTLDENYSVVRVGSELKSDLENYGFTVIHDKTDNVSASFKKAYEASYKTISKYIGKVDVYVDLHRDAYYGQKNNTVKFGDKDCAHICFVVAKGENYTYKPNWQDNYKLALKLTEKLNEICPGIAKDIIFKNYRFNQHVSKSCLLMEFGNEHNTIDEVNNTASVVAMAMNEIYK